MNGTAAVAKKSIDNRRGKNRRISKTHVVQIHLYVYDVRHTLYYATDECWSRKYDNNNIIIYSKPTSSEQQSEVPPILRFLRRTYKFILQISLFEFALWHFHSNSKTQFIFSSLRIQKFTTKCSRRFCRNRNRLMCTYLIFWSTENHLVQYAVLARGRAADTSFELRARTI